MEVTRPLIVGVVSNMRRPLAMALVGLLVGAALINLIEQDPGYVFISIAEFTIETSFWFALLFWLLAWGLISLTLGALRVLFRGRRWVSGWVGERKTRNAGALTNQGLINFIEGHWGRARRQLLRSARYSDVPLVNHLVAAQASFRLGDLEEMRRQLGLAETVEAGAGIALELTQAELQLTAGQYEEALATMVRARSNASKHPHVLELLARAHRKLADWDALRELLPELRRHQLLESPHLSGLEAELWLAVLDNGCRGAADAAASASLWHSIPLAWRETGPLRRRYARCLVDRGLTASHEKSLIAMIDKQWDVGLVSFIGTYPPVDGKRLDKAIERWLENNGQDTVLLVAAARVAQYRGDWQQARLWFEKANTLEPTASTYMELARLVRAQGDGASADNYLRLGGDQLLEKIPLPSLPDLLSTPD